MTMKKQPLTPTMVKKVSVRHVLNCLIFSALCGQMSICKASEKKPESDVSVSVHQSGNSFEVDVSYLTHMDACNAFAFITNYEDAKNITGIIESKIISRTNNKVVVERKAKETVLLFHIEISSTIEYTEIPYVGLNFEQIHGDNKIYRGTWRLDSKDGLTRLTYHSLIEPGFNAPKFVMAYFIRNSIRHRFESMAARAAGHLNSSKCP